ncbi:MAG: protoheme IX farnesyltransferase [Actinobacteria bacterium RBG_16_68_21]|nr:MAG: protoheme IX farnesyltransferase [Actinobacteria bacterium RBG_16_68_21]
MTSVTTTAGWSSGRVRAYVALIKPRIIELLLITTVPAMVLAAQAWPGTWLVVATLLGGIMSAGGANAINNVVDRDIDSRMDRTRRRPLPTRSLGVGEALAVGIVLGVGGFVWLWLTTTLLAGLLATAALVFYVLVYTMFLKRTTPQNIVIGGAAGAVPALVGWAAVTGTLALPAWVLFAVVFFWTPPHFWALALQFEEDYARAGVPMLPVVSGERMTTLQITLYAAVVGGVSLMLQPAADLGGLYLWSAVGLGLAFVAVAATLLRDRSRAMMVFRFSNIYLTLLFSAVMLDVML